MPSPDLPRFALPAGVRKDARRVAAALNDQGRAQDLRVQLRQAKVLSWSPYAAGPPEQPAGVTVDVYPDAIIPVLGGLQLAADDGVWLAGNGRGRWICLGRIDAGDPSPTWSPQMKSGAGYVGAPSATQANVDSAWNVRDGWVDAEFGLTVTSWGVGASTLWINLPAPARAYAASQLNYNRPIGRIVGITDPGGLQFATDILFEGGSGAGYFGPATWTTTSPTTWLAGTSADFHGRLRYRAA